MSTEKIMEQPVNARLLEALIQCRDRFLFYVEHHLANGAAVKAAENDRFVTLANQAIAAAEAQQERLLQDMHDAGREIDRVMAEAAPKAHHQEPMTIRLDPNALCRNALAREGKPYPKSNCQRCGTLMRPGWKCADGVELGKPPMRGCELRDDAVGVFKP